MNTTRTWRRARGAAILIAAGLLALGSAGTASADTNLVDPTRKGTLTIHKYEAPETATGLPDNGTQQMVDLPPLEGVGFTVYKVDPIDLTTNAGWRQAAELSDAFDGTTASITSAGYTASAIGAEKFTDGNGVISLSGLDLGLYYVVETTLLPGSTAVAPFLVTLPLTDPDNSGQWLYDVHVYPKNAMTSLTKTVDDDQAVKLGDEITYTIQADIPNVDVIDAYKIVDDLDSKLDYVGTVVTLTDGTPLVLGTDYTVTPANATTGGPEVVVEFTAAGRAKLVAHSDAKVQVVITTTVNTIGEIVNQALLYPNAESYTIEPGQPGGPTDPPEVLTKWGEITLQKLDAETRQALSGAVFSVYLNEADAKAGTNPISLEGKTEFAVDSQGVLTISGLRYSDWADGATVTEGDADYRTYWLAEVAAPTGYELLAEPISFIVDSKSSSAGVDLEVLNVASNAGFDLPRTGGAGSLAFWLGGGLLIGGALLLAVYARRRSRSAA